MKCYLKESLLKWNESLKGIIISHKGIKKADNKGYIIDDNPPIIFPIRYKLKLLELSEETYI